jgi:hypothetical protein
VKSDFSEVPAIRQFPARRFRNLLRADTQKSVSDAERFLKIASDNRFPRKQNFKEAEAHFRDTTELFGRTLFAGGE